MTKLTIPQTYALARQAGFSPAQAVTATAIAMAESGLVVANRCKDCFPGVREDSNGLWQINVDAHPQYDAARLRSDPLYNAKAAYEVSGGGKTFRPWSTYTNGAYRSHLGDVTTALGGKDPVSSIPTSTGGTTTSAGAAAPAAPATSSSTAASSTSASTWTIPIPGLPDIHLDAGGIKRGALAAAVVVGGVGVVILGLQRMVAPTVKRTLDSGAQAAGMAAML